MYVLQLVQRNESFHVELYNRHDKTHTKISLGYITLEKAEEIYKRIPTFEAERLWRVMTSNYAVYSREPTVIHEQRDINLPKLTETADDYVRTPQTSNSH